MVYVADLEQQKITLKNEVWGREGGNVGGYLGMYPVLNVWKGLPK